MIYILTSWIYCLSICFNAILLIEAYKCDNIEWLSAGAITTILSFNPSVVKKSLDVIC